MPGIYIMAIWATSLSIIGVFFQSVFLFERLRRQVARFLPTEESPELVYYLRTDK